MSRSTLLFIALLILALTCFLVSGCASHGLGQTCDRFGMQTEYVDVIALDHEVLDKAYTKTTFRCIPKTRYKSGVK
jgi:hypothetical protein